MLALKLSLVAASVLLASLAARRYGHAVAGTLAGLPVIAGPIMGFVLLQLPLERGRAIALATLVCLPAMVLHQVVFARVAQRRGWRLSLLAANGAYLKLGLLLSWLALPPAAVCALALAAPAAGLRAMPSRSAGTITGSAPPAELVMRVAAALAMGAAIIVSASGLPPMVSGLLLALPITGNVLPCFTLPRDGSGAAVALLSGFVRGLWGFSAFFVALYAGLGLWPAGAAYAAAWGVAAAAAFAMYAVTARRARRTAASAPSPGA